MRTVVISDIHANLEALTAVLNRISTLQVDEIVCLGDVVGYNANPNECIDILRSEKILCVLGNHDAAASGLEEPDSFNPQARAAILWTREQLTSENRQYLIDLQRERSVRDFYLFHGSIHDTNRYILFRDDAVDNFRELARQRHSPDLGFFGHSHIMTVLIEQDGIISTSLSHADLFLHQGKRYLINPGSVGQPRDGDPRAAFLVYDDRDRKVTFYRIEYDLRRCQDKIINAGLPPRLAERLAWGR
ncbi:MAG TPA: metallophosphoesterase family protein [Nitrospirota bacterium]|nr:metallophosphoesterase family protein [Nitrospirota bacterium]